MYNLECPYCEIENTIDDFEDEFEIECSSCGENFKVEVEYEPIFRTSQFNYVECEECGRKFDKDYSARMPTVGNYNSTSSLCEDCYYELQTKDNQEQ